MDEKVIHGKITKKLSDITSPRIDIFFQDSHKHSLGGNYELWRLARYIFSEILKIKVNDQPLEKVNWFINFLYKGEFNCSISHEKFGFRIRVSNADVATAKVISEEIESKIYDSLHVLMPLIDSYAESALSKGEAIISNRYEKYYNPYSFFLKKTKTAQIFSNQSLTLTQGQRIRSRRNIFESRYYEQATYHAFFSLLEHLCVLLLAFTNKPERENVSKFSNLVWSDKFKIVFDLQQKAYKEIYNDLIGIARYQRNPETHGGAWTIFNFYLDGAKHMFSANLQNKKISVVWGDQSRNFQVLEKFIKLIKSDPETANGMAYIGEGFNISFSKTALSEYQHVKVMSKVEFGEYVRSMHEQTDDMLNMDW